LLFFISISSHYQNGLALFSKAIGKTIIFGANSVLYAVFLVFSNLIFLAWFDLSVLGYLISIVIANTASIVFLIIIGKIPVFILPTKINLNTVKMLKYSIPLVFNSLAWMIISYSDKFMLKFLLSSSAVGIYAIAIKIPSLLSSVVNVMIQAWTITTIKYLDNGEETKVFYSRIFKYFLMSIVFIAFTLMSTLKYFMKYYVSSEYYSSYIYVPVLLVAACFLGLMNFFGSILSSNKDSKSIMLSSSVGAMINVIINFLLIPIFGIMGASIATAFSYFSIMLYRALITKSIIIINIQKKLSIFSISVLITQAVLVSRGQDSLLLTMLLFLVLILINNKTIKNLFQTLLKKGRSKEEWKQ
jgi:O-antigen/teichoic acid export membrane protein